MKPSLLVINKDPRTEQNVNLAAQVNQNFFRDRKEFAKLYTLFMQTDKKKWLDLFFLKAKMIHFACGKHHESILRALPTVKIPEMTPEERFNTFFDYYHEHHKDLFVRNAIVKIICEDPDISTGLRVSLIGIHYGFAEKKLTFGDYMKRLREGDLSPKTISQAFDHAHRITEWEQLTTFLTAKNIIYMHN